MGMEFFSLLSRQNEVVEESAVLDRWAVAKPQQHSFVTRIGP
jgi:hypothetical protein